MEGQVAVSSSMFFIELVVIAAVIFSFFDVVDATTDPNDGTGLRIFFYLLGLLLLFFFCFVFAAVSLIWLVSFLKWKKKNEIHEKWLVPFFFKKKLLLWRLMIFIFVVANCDAVCRLYLCMKKNAEILLWWNFFGVEIYHDNFGF